MRKFVYIFLVGMLAAVITRGCYFLTQGDVLLHVGIFQVTIDRLYEVLDFDMLTNIGGVANWGVSYMYFFGHSFFEEIMKLIGFIIGVRMLRPRTIFMTIVIALLVGCGFGTMEHVLGGVYGSSETLFIWFLRIMGHAIFASFTAYWYSLGTYGHLRWIEMGAHGSLMNTLYHRIPRIIQIIWIGTGLCLAALVHAGINFIISIDAPEKALFGLCIGLCMVTGLCMSTRNMRPYGRIQEEIDLMNTIFLAQKNLEKIHNTSQKESLSHSEKRVSRKFAKKHFSL